ncbi:MAG: hypothetical protein ACOX6P_08740 [Candidatus Merdivicinus sp.]
MKISASFDTFDEAENCARTLKHTCEGIQAIRIRKRTPLGDPQRDQIGDPPAQVVPFALYNGATTVDNVQNNLTGGPYSGAFAMDFDFDEEFPRNADGPQGRQDCMMDILAMPDSAHQIEQVILNEHGRHISRVQL